LFNKKLSQLEAIYQVEKPVAADPLHISDFIHHVFENQEKYEVTWQPDIMVTSHDVRKLLESRGYNISTETIKKGIGIFENEG